MRIDPSVGAGTLRPATKNVKKKVASARQSEKPTASEKPAATTETALPQRTNQAGKSEAQDITTKLMERAGRIPRDQTGRAAVAQSRQIIAANDRAEAMEAESHKDLQQPKPAPSAAPPLPPPPNTYAVELSLPTGELVTWYCRITHHRPEFVVEGIVYGALERAHEAYAAGSQGDDSFDMVLEDVLHATCQRSERQPKLIGSPEAAHLQVEGKAHCLLSLFAKEANRSVKDVASAAIIFALETILGVDENEPTGADGTRTDSQRRKEFFEHCEDAFQRRMALRRMFA